MRVKLNDSKNFNDVICKKSQKLSSFELIFLKALIANYRNIFVRHNFQNFNNCTLLQFKYIFQFFLSKF